jgi:hypothetical protein
MIQALTAGSTPLERNITTTDASPRSPYRRCREGKPLQCRDDVPDKIRDQLVAEEQQRLERYAPASASTPFPPINITNVLPSSHQPSMASSVDSSTHTIAGKTSFRSLEIPGTLDTAVQLYSNWQQSNFTREDPKADVQTACDTALNEGLDLEQIYTDQDYEFFVCKGVKRGVDRPVFRSLATWLVAFLVHPIYFRDLLIFGIGTRTPNSSDRKIGISS